MTITKTSNSPEETRTFRLRERPGGDLAKLGKDSEADEADVTLDPPATRRLARVGPPKAFPTARALRDRFRAVGGWVPPGGPDCATGEPEGCRTSGARVGRPTDRPRICAARAGFGRSAPAPPGGVCPPVRVCTDRAVLYPGGHLQGERKAPPGGHVRPTRGREGEGVSRLPRRKVRHGQGGDGGAPGVFGSAVVNPGRVQGRMAHDPADGG